MLEIYGSLILRTILLYAVILLIFRLMGKREIGELSILDLVVFVMLAEMAVMGIDKYEEPIFIAIVPMILILVIQVLSAFFSLKSRKFRRLMDGEPTIIIKNGNILESEMKKQRYTFDDLLMQLREKDIRHISEVEFALLESNGKLSVFKKDKKISGFTVPLILEGEIEYEKLDEINKTEQWLYEELRRKGITDIKDVAFCSFDNGNLFVNRFDKKKS